MGLFKSVVSKLKQGLSKTREVLLMDVRDLFAGRDLDDALIDELESRLLKADMGVQATAKLIDSLRADYKARKIVKGDEVVPYLKAHLRGLWPKEERGLRFATSGPTIILVTGVNGAGKTTSIAKLAASLRGEGKKVLLAACDTFRAGAVRQLEIWGERLGVEVIKGQQGGDPAAVAFDACKAATARGVDVLIIDTAGRLHTQDPLMRQLAKIRSVVARQVPGAPHETLLVLDATAGQNALRQVEEFTKATELSGIVLSKLDGTAKGGIVVAVKGQTNVPVKFVGVGERPEDLEPFDPERFVEAMFASEDAA
jgi:fused signal recognition particle receptor